MSCAEINTDEVTMRKMKMDLMVLDLRYEYRDVRPFLVTNYGLDLRYEYRDLRQFLLIIDDFFELRITKLIRIMIIAALHHYKIVTFYHPPGCAI